LNYAGKFDAKLPVEGSSLHSSGYVHVETVSPHTTHAPSDAIVVPDAHLLFNGDYKRSGVDLILSKDGRELVVEDYFKGEKRAALASPDGHRLTGDIVNALVGHVEYAQAAPAPDSATVIGHVTKLAGNATVIRNGVSIVLNMGDNVNKGDVVQSGSNSSLGITFIDGTVFGLSSNARMVLNEMVYDPNGSNNSSLLSLVAGTITFVAGETAKHGDMKVDTPVATLGIRGTAVLVEIDFQIPGQGGAPPVNFQVLAEPDGTTGSYVLFSKPTDGSQPVIIGTVNQSGQSYSYTPAQGLVVQAAPPLPPAAVAIIQQVFTEKFQNYTPPPAPDKDNNATPQTNPSPGSTPSSPPAPATPLNTSPINGVPIGTTSSPIPISITVPATSTPDGSNATMTLTVPVTITPTLINVAPTVAITTAGGATNQQSHTISGTVAAAGQAAVGATVTLVDTYNGVAKPVGTATVQADGTWTASNLTLVGNGTHSIVAVDTDPTGNPVISDPVVFTLSTVAPTVAIVGAGGATNQQSHTITGMVSVDVTAPGSTVMLFDNGSSTPIGTAIVQADGTWTANVKLAGDGTHSIVAVDTDLAGNVGTSAPVVFTVNTVVPTVAITTTGGATNQQNQTISGKVSADVTAPGSTVALFDKGGTTPTGTATVQADGSWTANVTLGDGTHSIVAIDTDLAGNLGSSAPVVFTVNTVVPMVAIATAGGATNQQSHTITGMVSADVTAPGSTVTLFDNGSITPLGTAIVQPDGTWTANVTLVGNGTHSIVAQDIDLAGNTAASAPVVFGLDTVAPAVAITTVAGPTNVATHTITGTVSGDLTAPNSTVSLFDSYNGGPATEIGTAVVGANGLWTAPNLTLVGDGVHSITAQDTDTAGNSGTSAPVVFTLDTVVPTVAITTMAGPTNAATHTITGTVSADSTAPGSTVTLLDTVGGVTTQLGTATVQADGTWTATNVTLVGDGVHSVTAQDVDAAGTVGISAPVVFTLDTVAPTVSITTAGGATNLQSHVITGMVSADVTAPGSMVTLFDTVGGVTTRLGTATVQADGSWTANDVTLVGDGVHSITAQDLDGAGNVGTSAPVVFTLQTGLPTVAITTLAGLTNVSTQTITGTVSADVTAPGSTVTLFDNGGITPVGTATVQADGTWTAKNVTLVGDGVHSIAAQDVDAAGNTGISAPVVFTLDTATPTVAVALNSADVNLADNTAIVTFTFSQPPSDFTLAHTSAVGGTLSALTPGEGGTTYTATFTANPGIDIANGSVSVDNTWHNADGNLGTGFTSPAFVVDTVAPGVAVDPVDGTDLINYAEAHAAGGVPLTGTVTGIATNTFNVMVADNGVTNTYTATVNGDGTWSATIPTADASALANGTATVSAQVTDINGNLSTVATQLVTVTETGPTVVVSGASPTLNGGQTDLITFTFSEAVTGFDPADVSVSGGTLGAITQSDATHYTATFTPTMGALLNLIDAPAQTNTPFALSFTASSSTTTVSIEGYQVPSFERTTQNGLFLNGAGPNLLGSTWNFTPAPSGSDTSTFSDGTSVPAISLGGVTVGSYDVYSQTIATAIGSVYTLDFLYSNPQDNAPSGLLVTTNSTGATAATIQVLASGTGTSSWTDLAGDPGTASNTFTISENTGPVEPFIWASDASGSWFDPASWNNGGFVPGTNDQVQINYSDITVTFNSTSAVGSLSSAATIDVTTDGSLTIFGTRGDSSNVGAMDVYGTLTLNGGTLNNNDGTSEGLTGSITVENGGTLTINGAAITNGALTIASLGTLDIEYGTNGPGATLDGVNVSNSGTVQVDAAALTTTLTLDDGTTITGGALTIGLSGTLDVEVGPNGQGGGNGAGSPDATLDGVAVTNDGAINVDLAAAGATLTLDDGTTISRGILSIGNYGTLDIQTGPNGQGANGAGGPDATLDGVTVTNNGNINVLTASGTILALDDGTIISGGPLTIGTSGALDIQTGSEGHTSPADATLDGVAVANGGNIEVLTASGTVLALDDGTTITGGSLTIDFASADYHGTVDVEAGPNGPVYGATLDGVSVTDSGALDIGDVTSGAILTLDDGTTVTGGGTGTLTIGSSGTLEIVNNGANTIGATLDDVQVNNSGTIQVGTPTFTFDPTLTLDDGTVVSGGIMTIESGDRLALNDATITGRATVTNQGLIDVTGSSIIDGGAHLNGNVTIESGQALTLSNVTESSTTLAFAGTGDLLKLDQASSSGSTISGLVLGDAIDLTGVGVADNYSFDGTTLTLKEGTTVLGSLSLSGLTADTQFNLASDNNGGTTITEALALSFTTIDDPGATATYAYGINNAGQIVGEATADPSNEVGWEYSAGAFATVGVTGAQDNGARAINNLGEVVGSDSPVRSTPRYGLVDINGTYTQISLSPDISSGANGVNDAGVVVGQSYLHSVSGVTPVYTGYIDDNGTVTYLNAPGTLTSNGYTAANGINDAGQIVGDYETTYGSNNQGFLYQGGVYTTIDDPNAGAGGSSAQGINDNGVIVGSFADANNKQHGFVDIGGVFTTVDDPLGVNGTMLSGINDAGVVVGSYIDANNVAHGFVANPTVTITVLTSGGLDFQGHNPLKEMGAGTIQSGGNSTTFTIVDAAANHEFVLDGCGFTYGADGGVTGGTLTSFHEFTADGSTALADFTGLLVDAASWMSAVQQDAAGNKTAAEALTGSFAYVFNGGSGADSFGSAGHADTLSGTGVDFFDGGGAPAGSHDTETGGAGSTFVFGAGYGALTVTNFDQANGTFDHTEGDHIELNGFTGQPTVTYVNGNTIADFGNGDVLTLLNVDPANLSDSDFIGGGGGNGNNNGPAITGANNTVTYTGTPVYLDPSITVTDATGTVISVDAWFSSGAQTGDALTVSAVNLPSGFTLSITDPADGTITDPDGSTIGYHFDGNAINFTGTSGSPSLADFNAALEAIQFTPGAVDGPRTVTWAAHEAVNTSPTVTTTVNVPVTINLPAGTPDGKGGYVPVVSSNNIAFSDSNTADVHTVASSFDSAASNLGPLNAPIGEFSATLGQDTTGGNPGLVDWSFTLSSTDLLLLDNAGPLSSIDEVFDVNINGGAGGPTTQQILIDINGAPLPGTIDVIAGASGPLSFAPASSEVFQLQGATISGSSGNGLSITSTDTNSSDNVVVETDHASSISVSGANEDGISLDLRGGAANAVVFNAAYSISAIGTGTGDTSIGIFAAANGNVAVNDLADTFVSGYENGIKAFGNNGSGNVAVNVYANATIDSTASYGVLAVSTETGNIAVTTSSGDSITSGSVGIAAINEDPTIAFSANSVIDVNASGTINSGSGLTSAGHQPAGILAGYLGPGPNDPTSYPISGLYGTVFVNDSANINAASGDGIRAFNYGDGNITVNDNAGTITALTSPHIGYGNGIAADNFGTGSTFVTTASGDRITSGSVGIDAVNEDTSIALAANSVIDVTTAGTIDSGSTDVLPGIPSAGISAGYLGGSAIPPSYPVPNLYGSVLVNNTANIDAAGGDGIRAFNYGDGNITVNDNAGMITAPGGSSPVDGYANGISADNFGTGSTFVTTAAGTQISSGGDGIFAFDGGPATPTDSVVSVIAYGTISSGDVPDGGGFPAAGIEAGYNNTLSPTPGSPDSSDLGNVSIDDFASITAAAGTDGIRGFNYGTGAVSGDSEVTITVESGAIVDGPRYGVDAFGQGGNISVTNHGSITGGTDAIYEFTLNSGTESLDNFGSLTGDIALSSGPSVTPTITNEIGADWSLNGSNQVTGSALTNNGTIDSNGTSVLSGLTSLTNAGTIEVQSGSLQLGASSAISGTGTLKIDTGATLEITSGVSSSETVVFNSTTGMLKLDQAENFHGVVSGFSTADGTQAHSDQIDLADINHHSTSFSETFNASTDVLTVSDGTTTANIQFSGNVGSLNFVDDGNLVGGASGTSGTIVYDPPSTSQSVGPIVMHDPGPAASSTIVATAPNQTLSGFAANDNFVFNFAAVGQATVANFDPATDMLQFSSPIFSSAQAILNATQDDGHGNTVIAVDAHDTITLSGVLKAQLHASDFHVI
jgi:hypothetical protein